ncbi:MAG: PEGA domain-containing protein, partial [Candidatus Omnitrophota bacterium]|nr:PEGA domain-containing protein [Candidatus Omnitrophota bacterium]
MMLLRRILFILFCLAYVIFCPLIILNTLGIVISPQHRQNIVKTGLVYLSTLPPGARVYLSRYRYPQKTPTMIRNLPPGQYSLKVELKNYRPWQKIVSVEKEKATVLENIILIPERWDARLLDLRAFETLLPVANGSLFLIRQGPLLKDCTIFRATSGKPEPAMPPQAGVPDGTALIPLTVSHSPYGDAKILSL